MLKSMRVRLSVFTAAVATSLCIAAAPAAAQQEGLVNVDISGNTVQVPIAVAANICDVNVAVLVDDLRDDAAMCNATADADAITPADGDGGGAGPQEGLVNVIIADNTVQVPIAVAANVCDVNVAVLVDLVDDEAAACEADADAVARDRRPSQNP
jgi:hypothetical protein